jgi:hypothetical protein
MFGGVTKPAVLAAMWKWGLSTKSINEGLSGENGSEDRVLLWYGLLRERSDSKCLVDSLL